MRKLIANAVLVVLGSGVAGGARGPATPGFSNATMVLPVDGEFRIGTFAGDRVGCGSLE